MSVRVSLLLQRRDRESSRNNTIDKSCGAQQILPPRPLGYPISSSTLWHTPLSAPHVGCWLIVFCCRASFFVFTEPPVIVPPQVLQAAFFRPPHPFDHARIPKALQARRRTGQHRQVRLRIEAQPVVISYALLGHHRPEGLLNTCHAWTEKFYNHPYIHRNRKSHVSQTLLWWYCCVRCDAAQQR